MNNLIWLSCHISDAVPYPCDLQVCALWFEICFTNNINHNKISAKSTAHQEIIETKTMSLMCMKWTRFFVKQMLLLFLSRLCYHNSCMPSQFSGRWLNDWCVRVIFGVCLFVFLFFGLALHCTTSRLCQCIISHGGLLCMCVKFSSFRFRFYCFGSLRKLAIKYNTEILCGYY